MNYEIKVLDLGHVELDASVLVNRHDPGTKVTVPTYGHLVVGGDQPVLVDTSFRDAQLLEERGMTAVRTEEQQLEAQLGEHGYELTDVGHVIHTHLHIDHAGQDHRFPMDTPVVVSRRELEFAVSGVMGLQYPPKDVKHLIDRLHTDDALILLDHDAAWDEPILPGIRCMSAGGHTDGSLNVVVETDAGTAVICSDVVYDLHHQVIDPVPAGNSGRSSRREPAPSGNHSTTLQQEKRAIKRALDVADVLLPMHDRPAKVNDRGEVVGRYFGSVPGPEYSNDEVEPSEFKFERPTG